MQSPIKEFVFEGRLIFSSGLALILRVFANYMCGTVRSGIMLGPPKRSSALAPIILFSAKTIGIDRDSLSANECGIYWSLSTFAVSPERDEDVAGNENGAPTPSVNALSRLSARKHIALIHYQIPFFHRWLGRGSMFVLSAEQARTLLGAAKRGSNNAGSVVDIGAGDGEVSRRFAHLYTNKYATEISGCMRKALSSKGFTILDTEDWWREQRFDCVCMLNLLDRCAKPRSMLQQAKAAIAPDGVLLLALVLPYKPYVEVTSDHKPEERLPIQGVNFEEQVASFVQIMRDEIGFELAAWSRAPYLCEGDFAQAYYWLDDSVYVFTPSRT
ncbi:jg16697 [Pararge aegeria aegeria]|uniref:Jg16697 protein n=1 Tax=Pararge aegeria aegeria TaxID=348720 RepID=A0A8S4RKF8_9NEOP|nr:jg16697 [Pararge aegeria aegeria]